MGQIETELVRKVAESDWNFNALMKVLHMRNFEIAQELHDFKHVQEPLHNFKIAYAISKLLCNLQIVQHNFEIAQIYKMHGT